MIFSLKKTIFAFAFLIVSIALVVFGERKYKNQVCKNVIITIHTQNEGSLLKEWDIKPVLFVRGKSIAVGIPFKNIDITAIEKKVHTIRLVKECQIHRDFFGNLILDIKEHKPIARLILNRANGSLYRDSYLSENYRFVGVSHNFTPKTLILSGDYFAKLTSLKKENGVVELIETIRADAFWRAQIVEMIVEKNGTITLLQNKGKQLVVFGKAEDIQIKLKKLLVFYTKIVPNKGLDTYQKVNVSYKNQIVCEK